jgi:flavin-dependent dehydrogenase
MLGLDAHIDDDPRTAYHLARNGVASVYLLDHAGAHGDEPPPPGLMLVRTLSEFADAVD